MIQTGVNSVEGGSKLQLHDDDDDDDEDEDDNF